MYMPWEAADPYMEWEVSAACLLGKLAPCKRMLRVMNGHQAECWTPIVHEGELAVHIC